MNEEILFKTGVDTGTFAKGCRSLTRIGKEFSSDFRSSMNEVGEKLAGLFTLGAIVEGVHHLAEFAENLKRVAESTDVSTDFLQGFQHRADLLGVSTETATKGLEKFAVKMGEAKKGNVDAIKIFNDLGISLNGNTQSGLLAAADALKKIEDPELRAAAATDLFGEKIGTKLIPILREGGDALQKFIDQTDKLGEEGIKQIDSANQAFKEGVHGVTLFGAKVVNAIATVAGAAGTLSAGGNPWEEWIGSIDELQRHIAKLNVSGAAKDLVPKKSKEEIQELIRLTSRREEADKKVVAARAKDLSLAEQLKKVQAEDSALLEESHKTKADSAEFQKIATERAEKLLEIDKLQKDIAKEKLDAEKKLSEEKVKQKSVQEDLAKAKENLATAKGDRSLFQSISELANSRVVFTGRLAKEKIDAQQVQRLENFAEWNRTHGFQDLASQQLSQADKLRAGITNLASKERDPFKAMEDAINGDQGKLAAIEKTIKGATIPAKK